MNFGVYRYILEILSTFKTVSHRQNSDHTPSVSLLIAAYNEGDILRQKLDNSLLLDYPSDLLEIIIVSDGSIDATNQIAKEFEKSGVKLIVLEHNQGKATALNVGIKNIRSEIILLSDANVMYEPDSVRKLVRNFADSTIGAVSGKVVLLNDGLSYEKGEKFYYSIEHKICQLESDTGNLIGADGAMYAVRRSLARPLQADTLLDDFVLSMGVIQQGKRLIFEPEAVGFERNHAEINSEYTRKVRIIAGGIQALQRKTVWPPNNQILTIIKLCCHKIMRWLIGPAIILFALISIVLGVTTKNTTLLFFAIALMFTYPVITLFVKYFPSLLKIRIISLSTYLFVMIKASVVGCYKALAAKSEISWR